MRLMLLVCLLRRGALACCLLLMMIEAAVKCLGVGGRELCRIRRRSLMLRESAELERGRTYMRLVRIKPDLQHHLSASGRSARRRARS